MDWDDAVGISMPLYTLVDVLFELQSRGFFRRQVRRSNQECRPEARNSHSLLIYLEL